MKQPWFEQQQDILTDLRELVAALKRRVPRPERPSEGEIASDAARLNDDAHRRILAIEHRLASAPCPGECST